MIISNRLSSRPQLWTRSFYPTSTRRRWGCASKRMTMTTTIMQVQDIVSCRQIIGVQLRSPSIITMFPIFQPSRFFSLSIFSLPLRQKILPFPAISSISRVMFALAIFSLTVTSIPSTIWVSTIWVTRRTPQRWIHVSANRKSVHNHTTPSWEPCHSPDFGSHQIATNSPISFAIPIALLPMLS